MDSYILFGKSFTTIPFQKMKFDEKPKGMKLSVEHNVDIDKFVQTLKRRYYEDLGNGDALSKTFKYIYFVYNDSGTIYYRMNGSIYDLLKYLNKKKINKNSEFYPDFVIYSRDISEYLEEIHNVTIYDLVNSKPLEEAVEINEFDGKVKGVCKILIDKYRAGDCSHGACMIDVLSKEELFSFLDF